MQHKGVEAIMAQDMVNLSLITSWVAWLDPTLNFQPVIDAWAVEAIKELDFVHEAKNMTQVAQNMKRAGLRVRLPDVLPDLVTRRVLVMTFEEVTKQRILCFCTEYCIRDSK